jgi:hypothetical protein
MQLSAFPPIVVPQPAAYLQPGADGNSGTPSGSNGTPFAQLLPVATPTSPTAAAPTSPSAAKTEKKPDAPTPSAEEATAALYGSWLAAVTPQPPPAVAPGKAVSAPAGGVSAANKLPIAAASLPGAAPLPAGAVSPSAATRGASQPAATPLLSAAANPAAVPAGTTNAAQIQAQAAAANKPTSPPASPKPVSPSMAPATLAADPTATASASPGTASDATVVKAARQVGAAAIGGAEKFAGPVPNTGSTSATVSKSQDKKILTSDSKTVTESSEPVGIGVAKVAPVMPTAAPTERTPSAMVVPIPVLAGSSSSNQTAAATPGPVSQQGLAQNAVDAAITAAESLSTGNQQAVNMQFSVGNADLSLRVELKNGEIHTTFRTDSADLRLDLQHEWQSANPGSGSGSVKLAEPIFTSSGNAASSAAGENAQQRGGQARQDTSSSASASTNFGSRATTSAAEAESPARVPVSHSSSLHLQAFA